MFNCTRVQKRTVNFFPTNEQLIRLYLIIKFMLGKEPANKKQAHTKKKTETAHGARKTAVHIFH